MQKLLTELADNEAFILELFVKSKSAPKPTRGQSMMTILEVADKTGNILARFFGDQKECDEVYSKIQVKKVYRFSGTYSAEYKSLTVKNYELVDKPDIESLTVKFASNEKLEGKLDRYISSIKDAHIKKLLELIFADSDVRQRFLTHPAAKSYHHAYENGLLTHVLEMTDMAEAISKTYPKMNRDLLVCGCILHDIGKIYELEVKYGTDYSDEGNLISHIPIGCFMISSKISEIKDFPEHLRMELLHMILSHHGRPTADVPSFMSPKTPEAIALHQVDLASSQIAPIHERAGNGGWEIINRKRYLLGWS